MTPTVRATAAALLLAAGAGAQTWPFQVERDDFSSEAVLDLRWMNEKTAGESGFVRVDEHGDFVLGSGKPVRFWAVGSTVGRENPYVVRPLWRRPEPDLARHARFLAKRGVNMVRLHTFVNPDPRQKPAAAIQEINEAERDFVWRAVAAYKKEGIYVTLSPYWAVNMRWNANWEYRNDDAHGLLFFDEPMQKAYKSWMRQLLAEPNPHTGVALASDPALAIIQTQNEDSLLFWTVNNLKGAPRERFGRMFYTWVVDKHGSWENAQRAWSNNRVNGDDPANGRLEFHNLFEMTQTRSGGFKARLDDQLEFWARTMHNWYSGLAKYLREELGCGQLINASNWKTGDVIRLEDVERWAYTATDVQAVNRYYTGIHRGPNNGWAIVRGDEFTSPSILRDPRQLPVSLKQTKGVPMLVTESTWVMPSAYATEGPFLVAAYQSLNGVDGFYWFSTWDDEWSHPQSANGYLQSQQKWMFASPDMLGTFPAAALLYRMGYVRRGEPVVVEHRSLQDLWQRRTPIIAEAASFDPNRDSGDVAPDSSIRTGVDPLAFLVGPVQTVFGSSSANSVAVDLQPYLKNDRTVIDSITGELSFDRGNGYVVLNAPKAQGVTGFFENRNSFETGDTSIWSGNEYASILVVAMDDRPLCESHRVLVQVGTRSRPTGWEERPKTFTVNNAEVKGFEVVEFGRAPWQVQTAQVDVTVRNARLTRARVLDMNGNAVRELDTIVGDGFLRFRFPDAAMYVVLD
jgi:hypothetical protein